MALERELSNVNEENQQLTALLERAAAEGEQAAQEGSGGSPETVTQPKEVPVPKQSTNPSRNGAAAAPSKERPAPEPGSEGDALLEDLRLDLGGED